MARHDGRADDAMRPVEMITGYIDNPLSSVLIHVGQTRVLCTCSLEERVPPFLNNSGEGWVTAEYAMLPGSTNTRVSREIRKGRPSGRTMEIQRLIGRALRSVVDRKALGERTLWIDCDVLQADGGTRTASITGAYVALGLGLANLMDRGDVTAPVLTGMLAAISVGVVAGHPVLDLDYVEDSAADVDMNVVRTDDGRYVELQGTAEATPFDRKQLDGLLALADAGIDRLHESQRQVLGDRLERILIPRAS